MAYLITAQNIWPTLKLQRINGLPNHCTADMAYLITAQKKWPT